MYSIEYSSYTVCSKRTYLPRVTVNPNVYTPEA